MSKQFFNKKILSNAFVVNGARVPFEQLAGNEGVIALDDAIPDQKALIDALSKAAREQRGGIISITEDEYSKKKIEQPFSQSDHELRRRKQLLGVSPSSIPRKPQPKQNQSGAAAANRAAPVNSRIVETPDNPNGGEWVEPGTEDAPRNASGLRLDGPTRQEYLDAGYDLKNYPPRGYAERDTPARNDPALKRFRPSTKKLKPQE